MPWPAGEPSSALLCVGLGVSLLPMSRHRWSVALGLVLSLAIARSEEAVPSKFDNLIKNPPFGQSGAGATPGESSTLEFRGIFADEGEYFFSLYETASRTAQWVGLKEEGAPYVVESYDSATQSVKVKYRNQPVTLALKRSQVVVKAPPATSPGPTPTVVVNPATADEGNRLALVAEEIRRRRAIRSQPNLQQSGNGPQNPPNPTNVPVSP